MSKKRPISGALKMSVLTAALLTSFGTHAAGSAVYSPFALSLDPGAWTKDRGGQPELDSVQWEGRDAIKLSVDPAGEGSSSFNNWQGYSQRTGAPAGESFLRGDLWIDSSWTSGTATDFQNTGLWGSASPEEIVAGGSYVDAESVFPIIHFTNQVDATDNPDGQGILRVWNNDGWLYLTDTAGLVNYGDWNSLDLRLVPEDSKIDYFFNGKLVYTWVDPTSDNGTQPGQFFAAYVKARNNGVTAFDAYFSRLLSGQVYRDGVVSGVVSNDVLVEAGAGAQVEAGTVINGSVIAEGSADAPALVTFGPSSTITGSLIGSNALIDFSANQGDGSRIDGTLELEKKSQARGGTPGNAVQAGAIALNDSTLLGAWRLPTGSVVAQNGAVIRDANISSGSGFSVVNAESGKVVIANSTIRSDYTGDNPAVVLAVSGEGTVVEVQDQSVLYSAANNTTVARVHDGGKLEMTGGFIQTAGTGATRGILAHDSGQAVVRDTDIGITGTGSVGVDAIGEHAEIDLIGGTLSISGDASYAVVAQSDGVVRSSSAIRASGQGSVGVFAYQGGKVEARDSSITTTGNALDQGETEQSSQGVLALDGGEVRLINVQVQTSGHGADAIAAIDQSQIAASSGTRLVTQGNNASGAVADGAASLVDLDTVVIQTSGNESAGLLAEDGGVIQGRSVAIGTSGANAHGVEANGAGSTVTLNEAHIDARGAGAAAVALGNDSSVSLVGVSLESAGATILARFEGQSDTGPAKQTVTLGDGTRVINNNGTLALVQRAGEGSEQGTLTINLEQGSFASGNILDKDAVKHVVVNKNGGNWAGIVIDKNTKVFDKDTESSVDNFVSQGSVSIDNGQTVSFTGTTQVEGDLATGAQGHSTFQGNTTIGGNLVGQSGSSSTFSQAATINQSVTGGDSSTFVFNGPTDIKGSLAGDYGSQFTFGNSATIAGDVTVQGSALVFSQTGDTTIGGDVVLANASSLKGGAMSKPIHVRGNVSVGRQALLAGNLDVQGTLSGAGGTLAPGNSIGVQSYESVAGFSGSYIAEVNAAGQADKIIVRTGNLDIGDVALTVGQEDGTGGYQLNHDYAIIETVAGNVVGQFASTGLDDSFAGTLVRLDPVIYNTKDVRVRLGLDDSKAQALRPGLTANQNAALDGVISVLGKNTSADAAVQSADTANVLNTLSGELHASTQTALLNSAGTVTTTISDQARLRSGALTPLWVQVVGNWNTLKGDGNTAKVNHSTGGVFVGGDAGLGGGWRLGAALGYLDGKIKVDERDSRSDVESFSAALYGANQWEAGRGHINFLAGVAYTNHKVDSRRHVTIGGAQTLKADYRANSTQLFTELGYAIPVAVSSVLEPYAGLSWTNLRAKSFEESGGAAALRSGSQKDDITTFTLGLRAKTLIDIGEHQASLSVGAGWRHAAGDVDAGRELAFVQGAGSTFKVAGAPVAKNAAVFDVSAQMAVGKQAALGVSYAGQYGSRVSDSSGTVHFRYKF